MTAASGCCPSHLYGVAPLEAASGKVTRRHRLNRGGNRQANHAPWSIVFTRLGSDARTRTYVARRLREGLSRREITRSLKRNLARETDLTTPSPLTISSGGPVPILPEENVVRSELTY